MGCLPSKSDPYETIPDPFEQETEETHPQDTPKDTKVITPWSAEGMEDAEESFMRPTTAVAKSKRRKGKSLRRTNLFRKQRVKLPKAWKETPVDSPGEDGLASVEEIPEEPSSPGIASLIDALGGPYSPTPSVPSPKLPSRTPIRKKRWSEPPGLKLGRPGPPPSLGEKQRLLDAPASMASMEDTLEKAAAHTERLSGLGLKVKTMRHEAKIFKELAHQLSGQYQVECAGSAILKRLRKRRRYRKVLPKTDQPSSSGFDKQCNLAQEIAASRARPPDATDPEQLSDGLFRRAKYLVKHIERLVAMCEPLSLVREEDFVEEAAKGKIRDYPTKAVFLEKGGIAARKSCKELVQCVLWLEESGGGEEVMKIRSKGDIAYQRVMRVFGDGPSTEEEVM